MFFLVTLFLACSDSEPSQQTVSGTSSKDCPKCPECPKSSSASKSTLSTAEENLLSPSLNELREGIKEFDSQSVGVCKGSGKDCQEFLGKTAKDLPEGKYMLHARLLAPKLKPEGGWKVEFHRECQTYKKTKNGETSSTNTYSKEYHISYSAKGYHLAPLATITSPGEYGRKECTWKLIYHNVNGAEEVSGSWSIPEKQ